MTDIVERARQAVSSSGFITHDLVRELIDEIKWLRAALKQIADDPGGNPAEDVVDEMRAIASRAMRS